MKRIRRITVEIVQRRQQLTMRETGAAPAGEPIGAAGPARESEPPEGCPRCGAPWVLLHEPDTALKGAPSLDLYAALASLDLHLQTTPGGQVWICRRSYDRLKETP